MAFFQAVALNPCSGISYKKHDWILCKFHPGCEIVYKRQYEILINVLHIIYKYDIINNVRWLLIISKGAVLMDLLSQFSPKKAVQREKEFAVVWSKVGTEVSQIISDHGMYKVCEQEYLLSGICTYEYVMTFTTPCRDKILLVEMTLSNGSYAFVRLSGAVSRNFDYVVYAPAEVRLNEVYVVGITGNCYGWMSYKVFRNTKFNEEVYYSHVNIRSETGSRVDMPTKEAWAKFPDLLWKMAETKTEELI